MGGVLLGKYVTGFQRNVIQHAFLTQIARKNRSALI